MSSVIDSIERAQVRTGLPSFDPGDRVRVHFQVIEGSRRRTQVFEGIVLKRQGSGARETFTVRKQSFGVGVERTFPLHSPKIEKLEIAARGDVRRAKLYYLRGRVGKAARVAERRWGIDEELISAPVPDGVDEPQAVDAEGVTQAEAVAEESPDGAPEGDGQETPEEARTAASESEQTTDETVPEAEAEGRGGAAAGRRARGSGRAGARGASRGRGDRGQRHGAKRSRREAARGRRLRRGLGKLKIPKPESRLGGLIELVVIVALALGLALAIQAWLIKPYQIPSESMEPTLDVGQRVLVNRFLYHFTDPSIGDIIVFHPPAGADGGTAECGKPHPPTRPAPCRPPNARTRTSSSGSSPGPATPSRFATGTRSSTA